MARSGALSAVLAVGGVVVVGLVAAGSMIWLREPAPTSSKATRTAAAPAAERSTETARLEPSRLLADARRQASAWHHDAVLLSMSASPLDARGVAPEGSVEFTYARPSGQRISGGADAGGESLTLRTSGGPLSKSQGPAAKGRVAPEPNCTFDDAWTAAQQAGSPATSNLSMRYVWSEKHARPVWEVLSSEHEVLRRLDGVTCSILTR